MSIKMKYSVVVLKDSTESIVNMLNVCLIKRVKMVFLFIKGACSVSFDKKKIICDCYEGWTGARCTESYCSTYKKCKNGIFREYFRKLR